MFEVDVNGLTQQYRTKPTMNVDITGSSGSIPKPLTYDYMPEGYPKKVIETVTLMEEQEVTFSDRGGGIMGTVSPVALAIEPRDKLTVVWDGVSYDVVVKRIAAGPEVVYLVFGNIGLAELEGATDHPFLYVDEGNGGHQWVTADTATSHTIKVMRPVVKYAPIDVNYMPEGYPKKNVKIDTFEEQEITFSANRDFMTAQVSIDFEIKQGDKLTVVWDGVSYDVVVKKTTAGPNIAPGFGNLGLLGHGDTTDHPFACVYLNGNYMWCTADTSPNHTIKVTRQKTIYTPIDAKFMPECYPKNLNVVFTGIKQIEDQQVPTGCNVTYDELRRFADNDMPIFAIHKYDSYDGVPMCKIITDYRLKSAPIEGNTDMVFYYQESGNYKAFVYNSDGTISKLPLT